MRVFCQDESRFGLLPITRRRLTLRGVKPLTRVQQVFESYYLYGAVEPTTGASCFLELPHLDTACFQLFLDHLAAQFPASRNLLILDNGNGLYVSPEQEQISGPFGLVGDRPSVWNQSVIKAN